MANYVHCFSVEDLKVIAVHASIDQTPVEDAHCNWFVSFSPEPEDKFVHHIVIGTVHAALPSGRADVSVGGLFTPRGAAKKVVGDDEEFPKAIAESAALETLYDFARLTLGGVWGTMEVTDRVPVKSPEPEMSKFSDEPASEHQHQDELVAK